MNGYNYYRWKLGRILLGATILFVIVCIGLMISNLRKVSGIVEQAGGVKELSAEPVPISHNEYEDLVKSFKEPYVPVNPHRRNIFSQQKGPEGQFPPEVIVPQGKYDFNKLDERLCVTKIYRKPVKLLFKGYMQLGDGAYVATINWAGKTDFKKIGDEIRGYKVADFKKNVSEKETVWGGTEKIDQSTITLERDTSEKFILEIGKITLEKEIYAEILDRKEMKSYEAYIGGEILDNKILDISADKVIIGTSKGEKVALKREKRENQ